jgi:hypothetical protein
MDGPNKLVPKTKIAEIPVGTKMRIDMGNYVVQLEKTDEKTTFTMEYISEKGGWGIVKIIDPNPDLALNDLVLSTMVFLGGTVSAPS